MAIACMHVGAPVTLQNFGRTALRAYGVTVGGVMDKDSAAIVNLLVGNEVWQTVVEFAQPGLTVQFTEAAWIAVGGAPMTVTLDGSEISMWQAVFVERGCVLQCTASGDGVWSYLAVAGGLRFADERETVSGLRLERRIQKGDRLWIADETQAATVYQSNMHRLNKPVVTQRRAQPPQRNRQRIERDGGTVVQLIRVLPGEHASQSSASAFEEWFRQPFRVSHQRNRMGYRLEGRPWLAEKGLSMAASMPSQPVVPGTLQLPPAGLPIVLLADCQTVGGYPVIAHVIEADLGAMAQVGAGQLVCFQEVTMDMAHAAMVRQRKDWEQLKVGLACCQWI